jgi:hypothetical protein
MPLTVKRITLWRKEVENRPGALAEILEPLAQAGADLRLVMGYRFPQDPARSAIELYPVAGKRQTAAAQQAGLAPSDIPCLLVEGDNLPGFGARLGRALAAAGINITFLIAEAIGRKAMTAIGFPDEATATAATKVIKGVGRSAPARRSARKGGR